MKRIIIELCFCAVCFSLGFFIHTTKGASENVVIKQGEIQYNTIDADPTKMTGREQASELMHFYGDAPTLELVHVKGDRYKAKAGLYKRSWDRDVSISIPTPRNMIIGNVLFDSHLRGGFMVQYFRMFGAFGIGGGIGGTIADQLITGGALFQW